MSYKALIISVDKYKNLNPLPNTVNDAQEITRLLLESPSLFNSEDVQVFHGSISNSIILNTAIKSFFSTAEKDDILFLFWAGHGAFIGDQGFFIPFDGDISNIENTFIRMTEVRDLIENTPAETVLSFFDTCHSGAIARTINSEVLARGLEVTGFGKVLIAACTENEFAWDRSGHGAFTDYLIKGLEGAAADNKGEVDVYTLYSYISKKLNEEFGNQNPVIKSTLNGKPILLKRVVGSDIVNATKKEGVSKRVIRSSESNFWLGSIIAEYDQHIEPEVGTHILRLINLDSKSEQKLKTMHSTKKPLPFAIRNQAEIVNIEKYEVESSPGNSVFTIYLTGKKGTYNSFAQDVSLGGSIGKSLSSSDIAVLTARRILFGETNHPNGHHELLLESMITRPQNALIEVSPDLIRTLIAEGCTIEQIRLMLIGSLILTRTIESIVELSFTIENEIIEEVHLIGYRHKYYSNVDPYQLEIKETTSIPLLI